MPHILKLEEQRENVEVTGARGFPGGSDSKESAWNVRDMDWIPGSGRSPWRREWQLTSEFLPGESHWQRSLVSYSQWGRKELDTEWLTHTHTHTHTHIGAQLQVGWRNFMGVGQTAEKESLPSWCRCLWGDKMRLPEKKRDRKKETVPTATTEVKVLVKEPQRGKASKRELPYLSSSPLLADLTGN